MENFKGEGGFEPNNSVNPWSGGRRAGPLLAGVLDNLPPIDMNNIKVHSTQRRAAYFYRQKIHYPWQGFNPRTLDPMTSTLTTRPPRATIWLLTSTNTYFPQSLPLFDSMCWPHVNPVPSGAVRKDCQRRLLSRPRFVRAVAPRIIIIIIALIFD
jgi:hypothetical protein